MKNWTTEEKLALLDAGSKPGAVVAQICASHGIGTSLFYKWRKQQEIGTLKGSLDVKRGRPKKANGPEGDVFQPESDKSLAQTVLRLAQKEAETRGISQDRFVAEALRFALARMK